MNNILQWNCKGLRARHEEVWLLINNIQPSCIYLQEIMLNNNNYSIERRYKLYVSIPLRQRSKGGVAIAIKKEISHKRLNIRTTLQAIALEIQPMGKGKRTICSIYLPPQDTIREEDIRELMNQLPTPIIMMGDFNAHNTVWGGDKTSARGKLIEKIIDDYDLLCLNNKEETYYRTHDGSKSTIDLTLVNNTLAPSLTWRKELDHFPIILKKTGVMAREQQQRWNAKRAN